MRRGDYVRQRDAMQCGVACLCMAARMNGARWAVDELEEVCRPTAEGVSLKGIMDGADAIGMRGVAAKVGLDSIGQLPLPAILHWNQNHFVVLHKVSRDGRRMHVADPAKGMVKYSRDEFEKHWVSAAVDGRPAGVALAIEPGPDFAERLRAREGRETRSFAVLWKYAKAYRGHFVKIGALLLLGCVLQLALPFLTQWIVDKGIRHGDIKIIWLILLGELMIVTGRAAADFARRWLLLRISMSINISLVSDFFIKLLKLPMSFFDTKLMGDLLQRMADHGRVQQFLTGQALGLIFTLLSFVVYGIVLFVYSKLIFAVFFLGSVAYGLWIARFLARRKVLDYDMFWSGVTG